MHLRRFVGSLAAQDEDYPLVAARQHMSALGQKRTSWGVRLMSALSPKADIRADPGYLRPTGPGSFATLAVDVLGSIVFIFGRQREES
jgi:hypothetical protein